MLHHEKLGLGGVCGLDFHSLEDAIGALAEISSKVRGFESLTILTVMKSFSFPARCPKFANVVERSEFPTSFGQSREPPTLADQVQRLPFERDLISLRESFSPMRAFTVIGTSLLSACLIFSSFPSATTSTPPNPAMPEYIVFSDVDGTLVHYPRNNLHEQPSAHAITSSNELIYLPPSKTGTRGFISERTLELCHQLRTGGNASSPSSSESNTKVPLVLISGMRTTTLLQRLSYLPRADAYVSESGGRIFYPVALDHVDNIVTDGDASFGLVEDLEWRNRISKLDAAGSDGFNNVPIQQRQGKLWKYASELMQRGYVLDTSGYATAFRINKKMQSTSAQNVFDTLLRTIRSEIPKELGHSTNLGCIDVYPRMSGKKNCCDYLVKRFCGSDARLSTNAYCMCDDDNDVEMATNCKIAYLPSVTSDSIKRLIERQRNDDDVLEYGKMIVMEDIESGIVDTKATERALEMILNELQ